MTDQPKTAGQRPYSWSVVILLLAPALLFGDLLGAQIGNQGWGFAVFSALDSGVTQVLEPLDFTGIGKVMRGYVNGK